MVLAALVAFRPLPPLTGLKGVVFSCSLGVMWLSVLFFQSIVRSVQNMLSIFTPGVGRYCRDPQFRMFGLSERLR